MAKTSSLAPLREVFSFPVTGADWKKRFLVGAGLLLLSFLIPLIPAIFVYGYILQIMRRVIDGQPPALQAWENWGRLGKDGLRVLLVGVVFLLPAIIVIIGAMGLYFAGILSFAFSDVGGADYSQAFFSFYLLTFGLLFLGFFVGMILMLIGLFPLPFATAHVASQNSAKAAFRFREWWPGLRRGLLDYSIAWVVVMGIGALAYLVFVIGYYSIVLICVLPFIAAPVGFYVMSLWAAIFGETYRENMSELNDNG